MICILFTYKDSIDVLGEEIRGFTHVIEVFGCLVEVPIPIYIHSGVQGLGRAIPVVYDAEQVRFLGQVVVDYYIIFWLSWRKGDKNELCVMYCINCIL